LVLMILLLMIQLRVRVGRLFAFCFMERGRTCKKNLLEMLSHCATCYCIEWVALNQSSQADGACSHSQRMLVRQWFFNLPEDKGFLCYT
jgi:hypothetical protein